MKNLTNQALTETAGSIEEGRPPVSGYLTNPQGDVVRECDPCSLEEALEYSRSHKGVLYCWLAYEYNNGGDILDGTVVELTPLSPMNGA